MILSVVSYEKKHNIYEKNFKLTKNSTLNHAFCNRIFPSIASYQCLKNGWTFINHDFFSK